MAQLGHGRVASLPCHLYLRMVLMYVTKVVFSHRVGGKLKQTEVAGNITDTETRHLVNIMCELNLHLVLYRCGIFGLCHWQWMP